MARADSARPWNAEAAARYLDGRAGAWKAHPKVQRSHGTACISCHTGLPYLLTRAPLRRVLGEPWYAHTSDKVRESRGTESVLNALVMARRDHERGETSPLTRQAFEQMWKEQLPEGPERGGWFWLNFGLAPWETTESQVFGACLAAVAVSSAPGYAAEARARAPVELLKAYLRRAAAGPLNRHTRLGLLWAASLHEDLLEREDKARMLVDILSTQRSDGGFSVAGLGHWEREDASPAEEGSDGYATGLVTYVLLRAGDRSLRPAIDKGLAWLSTHQDREGFWEARSANKNRDQDDAFIRQFMRDAASGYAVLALTEGESHRLAPK